jgi:class 3 adenylate cyclase/DNA-binding winged helix-turn-helix (wHTH) protein/predicted ATPase
MRYVFGECELDTTRHELRWRGQVVALEPLALRVLAYFVQHPGQAVAKGDLFQAFWPGAAEESYKEYSLRNCLTKIRQAVGDAGTPRAVLDTVRRYGYRFTAEVTILPSASRPADALGAADDTVSPGSAPDAPPAAPPAAVVRCLQCQTPTPATRLFCTVCGQTLARVCPQCGARNDPTARFCGGCGHAVTAPTVPDPAPGPAVPPLPAASVPSLAEAERRQLTVLFCDLVDFIRLARQLDPEDWRDVVRAYQQTCAAVIQRFDGYIAQYLGDGLLVYFGYPQAHEDDAQRAVRTGLGMVEAMGILNTTLVRDHGVRLAVRVGIHTGLVVVGAMGGGDRQEHLALGAPPNLAARLQGQAAPDTVVISAATHQLVQGLCTCQTLETPTLKGLDEPLTLYRVLAVSPALSPFAAASITRLTPLVGREEELGLLRRRWVQVQEGYGQVVLLGGEAGIGKSRLVRELYEAVGPDQATRIVFRCASSSQQSALYPMIEHLQQLVRESGEETPEAQCARLAQALRRVGVPVSEVLSLLAALLLLPHPAGYPPVQLSPERQKQKTQEALIAWLVAEAAQQPVLMVWEDLHWADPSTLELLGLFLEQAPTVRLLTVLTCRPTFVPPWASRATLTQLTLTRLTRPQVEAMVQRVAGGKALPATVLRQMVARTDGVPLFVEELTKTVLEAGGLQEEAEHYDLIGSLPALTIPTTLQDALRARLDRLSEGKVVAQLGAVLGRTFAYELLQAVAPLDELELWRGLVQLVQAEMLYQRGALPQATYLFKHALIQEAAYQSLLKSTRQQYHRRVAEVLAAQFPETTATQPELLARHYTEAGLQAQALPYWHQAGQRAIACSAYAEARQHFTTGLEVLATVPETPARHQHELDLLIALTPVLQVTESHAAPELEPVLTRAEVLAQQVGEPSQHVAVLHALWLFRNARAECQEAYALAEQLLDLAQRQHDPILLLRAHHALGVTLGNIGTFALARTHLEQGIALDNPLEQAAPYTIPGERRNPGVGCRFWVARVLWELGYPDQAVQRSQEALTMAHGRADPSLLVETLHHSAHLYVRRREWQTVQAHAEAMLALATEHGFARHAANGALFRGMALTMQGQGAEGLIQMRQGLAALRATGMAVGMTANLVWLAEVYGHVGQVDEGVHLLAEALAVVDTTENSDGEAELHRLHGVLLLRQAVPDALQAEDCFQQALDVARRQQAKSRELRAATSLVRLWQRQGKRDDAYALLAPIYGWFTEGFDTADLQEARALLAELA